MALLDGLDRILKNYIGASGENFASHELANFIRRDVRGVISQVAKSSGNHRLLVKGSAGQGNWTKAPWIAIFDTLVTKSAQKGYYPVYLFREDMKGVYLSLNQGVTEAKRIYRASTKIALRARAANYRAMLGKKGELFPETTIDLAAETPASDSAYYEAGNIVAKFYKHDHLPTNEALESDLIEMLACYETLMDGENQTFASSIVEEDEPEKMYYEDASRFRMHKRIERNPTLARDVKKILGYACQICSVNFKERYGAIGAGYIEAHHLKPLSSLDGKVQLNPAKDFAVLCANCHRMIHRSGCTDDIEQFKLKHFVNSD